MEPPNRLNNDSSLGMGIWRSFNALFYLGWLQNWGFSLWFQVFAIQGDHRSENGIVGCVKDPFIELLLISPLCLLTSALYIEVFLFWVIPMFLNLLFLFLELILWLLHPSNSIYFYNFYYFLAAPHGMQDLCSPTRDQIFTPLVETQSLFFFF